MCFDHCNQPGWVRQGRQGDRAGDWSKGTFGRALWDLLWQQVNPIICTHLVLKKRKIVPQIKGQYCFSNVVQTISWLKQETPKFSKKKLQSGTSGCCSTCLQPRLASPPLWSQFSPFFFFSFCAIWEKNFLFENRVMSLLDQKFADQCKPVIHSLERLPDIINGLYLPYVDWEAIVVGFRWRRHDDDVLRVQLGEEHLQQDVRDQRHLHGSDTASYRQGKYLLDISSKSNAGLLRIQWKWWFLTGTLRKPLQLWWTTFAAGLIAPPLSTVLRV